MIQEISSTAATPQLIETLTDACLDVAISHQTDLQLLNHNRIRILDPQKAPSEYNNRTHIAGLLALRFPQVAQADALAECEAIHLNTEKGQLSLTRPIRIHKDDMGTNSHMLKINHGASLPPHRIPAILANRLLQARFMTT